VPINVPTYGSVGCCYIRTMSGAPEWVTHCPDSGYWADRIARRCRPDPTTGCEIWQGRPSADGYGRFSFTDRHGRHRQISAHRAAWLAYRGDLAAGMTVDHLCRVRLCINVAHLEPVSAAVNIGRGVPYRPRRLKPRALGPTYPCGHPRTAENTTEWKRSNGGVHRACRQCIAWRRTVARARAADRADELSPPATAHPPSGPPRPAPAPA
jgi:hypothetical protein